MLPMAPGKGGEILLQWPFLIHETRPMLSNVTSNLSVNTGAYHLYGIGVTPALPIIVNRRGTTLVEQALLS